MKKLMMLALLSITSIAAHAGPEKYVLQNMKVTNMQRCILTAVPNLSEKANFQLKGSICSRLKVGDFITRAEVEIWPASGYITKVEVKIPGSFAGGNMSQVLE